MVNDSITKQVISYPYSIRLHFQINQDHPHTPNPQTSNHSIPKQRYIVLIAFTNAPAPSLPHRYMPQSPIPIWIWMPRHSLHSISECTKTALTPSLHASTPSQHNILMPQAKIPQHFCHPISSKPHPPIPRYCPYTISTYSNSIMLRSPYIPRSPNAITIPASLHTDPYWHNQTRD